MDNKDRYARCSECGKRTFSTSEGLLCSLTSAKPTFEDSCPNFDGDEAKVQARLAGESVMEDREASSSINGFLWFYLYVFTLFGAVTTLVSNFATFKFSDYGDALTASIDITLWILYAALCIYVIVAFNKRLPNAVGLAKTQLIMLVAINIPVLLFSDGTETEYNSSVRLAASVVWAVIFFIYLCCSRQVRDLIPKEKRHFFKWDKIIFVVSLVAWVGLFALSISNYAGANPFKSRRKNIEAQIALVKENLPVDLSEYLTFSDIALEDNYVTYVYTYKDWSSTESALDFSYRQELSIMGKERILFNVRGYLEIDPYVSDGYGIKYRYKYSDGEYMYEITHTAEEYLAAHRATEPYLTSPDVRSQIVTSFNTRLPEEYIGGTFLENVYYDDFGYDGYVFSVTIPGLNPSDLYGLTEDYLRSYMDENIPVLEDDILELAWMNRSNVTWRFTADCSETWSVTLRYTPEQYRDKVSFYNSNQEI